MNPSHNLAIVTDTPKQKTVTDYQQELTVLEDELKTCNVLIRDREARSYRVQHHTTQLALGTGDRDELIAAQAAFDASIEALIRKQHLEAAIAELRDTIRWQEGQERRQFVQSVKQEFDDLHLSYFNDCKALHEKFRQLHVLSIKYQGLVARPLLDELSYRLHLPPLIAPYDNVNIATGTKVRT